MVMVGWPRPEVTRLLHRKEHQDFVINRDPVDDHRRLEIFSLRWQQPGDSGRGQPTMTIEALAFRAADRITALAKRGEISG